MHIIRSGEVRKNWAAFISLETREEMEALLDDAVRPFGIHVNVCFLVSALSYFCQCISSTHLAQTQIVHCLMIKRQYTNEKIRFVFVFEIVNSFCLLSLQSQRCSILPVEERKTLLLRGLPLDSEEDILNVLQKFGIDIRTISKEGLFIVRDQHDNATGNVRIEFNTHADAYRAKELLSVPEAQARFIRRELKLFRFSVTWGKKNFLQELIAAKRELERQRNSLMYAYEHHLCSILLTCVD